MSVFQEEDAKKDVQGLYEENAHIKGNKEEARIGWEASDCDVSQTPGKREGERKLGRSV